MSLYYPSRFDQVGSHTFTSSTEQRGLRHPICQGEAQQEEGDDGDPNETMSSIEIENHSLTNDSVG